MGQLDHRRCPVERPSSAIHGEMIVCSHFREGYSQGRPQTRIVKLAVLIPDESRHRVNHAAKTFTLQEIFAVRPQGQNSIWYVSFADDLQVGIVWPYTFNTRIQKVVSYSFACHHR